jgi:hypothetical protein
MSLPDKPPSALRPNSTETCPPWSRRKSRQAANHPSGTIQVPPSLSRPFCYAAKFAWDIYKDRKKEIKDAAAREAVVRQLRLELKIDSGISDAQRDKVIAVVVDELTKSSSS